MDSLVGLKSALVLAQNAQPRNWEGELAELVVEVIIYPGTDPRYSIVDLVTGDRVSRGELWDVASTVERLAEIADNPSDI